MHNNCTFCYNSNKIKIIQVLTVFPRSFNTEKKIIVQNE